MMRHTPFAILKKMKISPKRKKGSATPNFLEEKSLAMSLSEEEILFAQAMQGVIPLERTVVSKDLQIRTSKKKRVSQNSLCLSKEDADQRAVRVLTDLINGREDFDLELTNEYTARKVKEVDERIFRDLKSGRFSPEAHLDLHGLNRDQALNSLFRFIRESYLVGRRCVLIIPGRGMNSPGGQPVLKEELKGWLSKEPLRRLAPAFCTALPRHGGMGAYYVLLRKKKKNTGKIRWEDNFY